MSASATARSSSMSWPVNWMWTGSPACISAEAKPNSVVPAIGPHSSRQRLVISALEISRSSPGTSSMTTSP